MKQNRTNTDGDLIRSYLDGNDKALKLLIEKWHLQFCKKALWIVKDADLAKDIAQDTWQVIIHKIPKLKEPDKFGSWGLRIVCNKSIDVLNKKNRERLHLTEYQYEQQEEGVDYNAHLDLKKQLGLVVKRLPTNQQVVLNLFYLESYSLKQIAELLNISTGTAKSRLFYAREKLKAIVKNKRKK